jgi:hypothetical protein
VVHLSRAIAFRNARNGQEVTCLFSVPGYSKRNLEIMTTTPHSIYYEILYLWLLCSINCPQLHFAEPWRTSSRSIERPFSEDCDPRL